MHMQVSNFGLSGNGKDPIFWTNVEDVEGLKGWKVEAQALPAEALAKAGRREEGRNLDILTDYWIPNTLRSTLTPHPSNLIPDNPSVVLFVPKKGSYKSFILHDLKIIVSDRKNIYTNLLPHYLIDTGFF